MLRKVKCLVLIKKSRASVKTILKMKGVKEIWYVTECYYLANILTTKPLFSIVVHAVSDFIYKNIIYKIIGPILCYVKKMYQKSLENCLYFT